MFGLGPTEMLIVLVIGVLLFGKNLPTVGRQLGKGLMEFKKGLSDIKNEVDIASYMQPSAPSARVAPRYTADDYDEPTAPKFEPPAQEPFAPPPHDPSPSDTSSESPQPQA
jgi:sec-independent protein translocase protein TatA